MNNDFDFDKADSGAQDSVPLSFPVVFWRHGNPDLTELGADNIKYTGGLFLLSEDELKIDGWKDASFKGDKDTVTGYAASAGHIVLVRSRKRWFKTVDNRNQFRPWNQYQPGDRGQMQAIGFIRGYDEPVCFSLKGMMIEFIQNILKEQNAKVLSVVNKEAPTGKALPLYSIWMTIKAGKHEKSGSGNKQSDVTYPEIVLPKSVDRDYCVKRYVGAANLVKFQSLYRELEQWSHEWDATGEQAAQQAKAATVDAAWNEPGNKTSVVSGYDEESASVKDDDIPF